MRRNKTPADVKKELSRKGVSVAGWARKHSVPQQTVRDLLSGKAKGHRGIAHRAAVLLGIKDGEL
ncbi:DNA-binding protein [Paucibacter sp. KBW04]|uniref:DNA-binding protein n=1 Tax=Paucibacter sp. KBW04 TaxID=2153361 RepID=UPI000F56A4D2|nr:DNA-binding protein [Paucibacter sp. KBW04]RQO63616.1 DNA-binding protein [Paucibacter sp. KBW04]